MESFGDELGAAGESFPVEVGGFEIPLFYSGFQKQHPNGVVFYLGFLVAMKSIVFLVPLSISRHL